MTYQKLPHTDMTKDPSIRTKISDKQKTIHKSFLSLLFKKILNFLLQETAFFFPVNSVRVKCQKLRGVKIEKNVFIGLHVILDRVYPEFITLEEGSSLAGGNHILTHSRPSKHFEDYLESFAKEVIISKGAWLGVNSIVLPGITIGEESVVSAGSVVVQNVPRRTIVRGNPAKVMTSIPELK